MKTIKRIAWWCFVCAVATLPLERIGALETDGGTLRLSQLFGALAMLGLVFQPRVVIARLRQLRLVLIPLVAFLAILAISITGSLNVSWSVLTAVTTVFTVFFGLSVPIFLSSEERLKTIVRVVLVSAALVSVFGLFQFFGDLAGFPITVTGLREHYTKEVFGFPRVQSTALEPLYFANFLLLPMCCAFTVLLSRRVFSWWWLLGFFSLFVVSIGLTISRGAYLAGIVALAVIGMFSLRRMFRLRFVLPVLFGVLLALIIVPRLLQTGDDARVNLDVFREHVQNVFYGASYTERVETFSAAIEAWHSAPWIGIGPGSFGPFVAEHPLIKPEGGWRIVNNEFLELLTEVGLLGVLAFSFFLWTMVLTGLRTLFSAKTSALRRALCLGAFSAVVGILVQYQTFSTLYIMHIWFAFGLLLATSYVPGKEERIHG